MPSAETKRPKRHRSANIDTTEDLLDEWLTPKNNPVMQGLVSFLNVQPTQAAPAVAGTTLSPGDRVVSHNADRTLVSFYGGDVEMLSPGDQDTLSSGDNKHLPYEISEINYPLPRKRGLSEIALTGGETGTVSLVTMCLISVRGLTTHRW